ncbi:MAG: hypothetical protein NZ895_04915 [Archaeoglobaceae archaeon]|nr:hypothetical protein [Archaeoglobaceae archaeon]MCX8152725.1 hypothetical protein [Archaeoglobaceae archaeon]MDW8013432.1 hypothetical protein [Archaeoglobaceae archaeon]
MNCRAVSPLIGFILLMAILMGLIGILQSTTLPQWNRAVETRHFSSLKYEVAEISEVLSISASTGSPAKVVFKAGIEYPNYYFLFSPPKSSTTITAKDLKIKIEGSINFTDKTSAILIEPNYLYSQRSKLIYEHSAVLRFENNVILFESDQNSFTENSIHLYIIKAKFYSFATTENANIIFVPEFVSGVNVFSGNLSFECFDEKTAAKWYETLSKIYEVSKNGSEVKIEKLKNVSLSITIFSAYVLVSGEVREMFDRDVVLVNVSPLHLMVNRGSTVSIGVKVLLNNSNITVKNVPVYVNDFCNGNVVLLSNELGEVWYNFYASPSCREDVTVTFLAQKDLKFKIKIVDVGCIFNLTWLNFSTGKIVEKDEWYCNLTEICSKNFVLNVKYLSSNVQDALVNFAKDSNIILINKNTSYTDGRGNATVNVTAKGFGTVNLIGIVGGCIKTLQITINPTPINYTLTLHVCGRRPEWRVNVDPPNSNCEVGEGFNTCLFNYPAGTRVTLTAIPRGNFVSWHRDCENQSNPCILTIDSNKVVFAEFEGCRVLPAPTPIIPTPVPYI